jgi:uncharacterized membrane protein
LTGEHHAMSDQQEGSFPVSAGILLGLHHVNETVPREQWIYWDISFLVWGAIMLICGWLLWRAGQRDSIERADSVHTDRIPTM